VDCGCCESPIPWWKGTALGISGLFPRPSCMTPCPAATPPLMIHALKPLTGSPARRVNEDNNPTLTATSAISARRLPGCSAYEADSQLCAEAWDGPLRQGARQELRAPALRRRDPSYLGGVAERRPVQPGQPALFLWRKGLLVQTLDGCRRLLPRAHSPPGATPPGGLRASTPAWTLRYAEPSSADDSPARASSGPRRWYGGADRMHGLHGEEPHGQSVGQKFSSESRQCWGGVPSPLPQPWPGLWGVPFDDLIRP